MVVLTDLPASRLNKYERKVADKVEEARKKKWQKVLQQGKSRRLYSLAVMTGYRRGQRRQHVQTALLKIEGAFTKEDSSFYVGKKCAFVYRGRSKLHKKGKKAPFRAIWGKVTRPHGNSGCVRAKFGKNLPPVAIGKRVRIMMHPSRI